MLRIKKDDDNDERKNKIVKIILLVVSIAWSLTLLLKYLN